MVEVEEHKALGSYYYSFGDKDKAEKESQKAIDKSSTKAGLAGRRNDRSTIGFNY